ncbi:MAG: type II toxin-antitoxin system VapC family toxin [Betaproteobacteria bacterium]|nr:type II toxin-antitoxin system VapC family toxin [Betaproteobacteria bacterium]
MLGIDTNVLIRYLIRDDEAQFEKARRLIRREVSAGRRIFLSLLVLLEAEWVLRSRYGLSKTEIAATVSALLGAVDIQLEDEPAVEEALYVWNDNAADFTDCLIGVRNRRLGCSATATFDTRAARIAGFSTA